MVNKSITRFAFILVIFSIILSFIFIIKEAHHDCTGEDCPICAIINQAKKNLEDFGFNPKTRIVLILCTLFVIFPISHLEGRYNKKLETLVGKKVRLDI